MTDALNYLIYRIPFKVFLKIIITDDKFRDGSIDIMGVLVASGLVPSRSEARRAIEQGGVSVNDEKVTDISTSYTKEEIGNGDFIVKKGKKSFKRVTVD